MNKDHKFEEATFAGGCFWCMQGPFQVQQGVKEVICGYAGGTTKNPTYEEVCSGSTGHIEVIKVIYDPLVVSYNELLDIFWRQIDPTDSGGQFADRGNQYESAIFFHSESQKKDAEKSKKRLEESNLFNKNIVTKIIKAIEFYKAEDYHQDYHKKYNLKYKFYRQASGRDQFLNKHWRKK